MPSPDQIDPTLTPDTFTPADAFDTTDPVNLDELGGEFRAWRAVLDLLARTGEALHIPDEYLPDTMMLNVCAGWHYMPTLRDAQGTHVLTCKYTGWNPYDVKSNFQPGSPFYERTGAQSPEAAATAYAAKVEAGRAFRHFAETAGERLAERLHNEAAVEGRDQ